MIKLVRSKTQPRRFRPGLERLETRDLPSFLSPVLTAVGDYPQALTTGDFNGDKRPDIAVANDFYAGSVSILLGGRQGHFRRVGSYDVGEYPTAIAAGHFRGTGALDLAVTHDNEVTIVWGHGDGTFEVGPTYFSLHQIFSIALSDLNGDNRTDIVVPDAYHAGTVTVFLGNGNGTFQAGDSYLTDQFPHGIAVVDYTGDGRPDLVTANQASTGPSMTLLKNAGVGTFFYDGNLDGGYWASSVVAADFNADGKTDLAVGHGTDSSNIRIFLGQGTGFQFAGSYPAGKYASSLVVADFDSDGKTDVAAATFDTDSVAILFGNGNGTFQAVQHFNAGSSPAVSIAVADFNRDGAPDVTAALPFADSVGTLLNSGGRSGEGSFGRLAVPAASNAEHRDTLKAAAEFVLPTVTWRPSEVGNLDPITVNQKALAGAHRLTPSRPIQEESLSGEEWNAF